MRHSFATVCYIQQMVCEHVSATPKTTNPGAPRWIPLAFFSPFEVPPAPSHPAVRDRCGAKFSWVISTTSRTRFWAVGRQTPAPRSGTNGAMTSGRRPSARGVGDFPLPPISIEAPSQYPYLSTHPDPGIAEETQPGTIVPPAVGSPTMLDGTKDPLGMRHHDGDPAIPTGQAGDTQG